MARVWPTNKAMLPNSRQRNLSLKLNEESKGTCANTEGTPTEAKWTKYTA